MLGKYISAPVFHKVAAPRKMLRHAR